MSGAAQRIEPLELHAHLDGELAGERADAVAAAIASDPALAARAAEYRRIDEALHRAYDPLLEAPLPAGLLHALGRGRRRPALRVAAAIAWLALGAAGGLLGARLLAPPGAGLAGERPLVREAAYAHAVYVPEVRHPVEVRAAQRSHLNAWLSKRLRHEIRAPEVDAAGYRLIGGRLLADAGRPAAQFMYQDEHGERMTLYVRAGGEGAEAAPLRHAESAGYGVVYWRDGGLAYALVGTAPRERLMAMGEAMFAALNP